MDFILSLYFFKKEKAQDFDHSFSIISILFIHLLNFSFKFHPPINFYCFFLLSSNSKPKKVF